MSDRILAAELAGGGQPLITDPALRDRILVAEAPYHEALAAISGLDAEGVDRDIVRRAQTEGYGAAGTYLGELLTQVEAIRPEAVDDPLIPEETAHGTPFVLYQPSELGEEPEEPIKETEKDRFTGPKEARVAAVIATSRQLTKRQLGKELGFSRSTANSALNWFGYRDLVIRLSADQAPDTGVPYFAHTRKFDAFMNRLPGWQHATQLRTLAHRLQTTEDEALTRLLKLATLL